MLTMTKVQEFNKEVLAALSLMTETDLKMADMEKPFVDLGVDSLMALELVVRLERRFGLVLSEDEIRELRTPADILGVAQAKGVL